MKYFFTCLLGVEDLIVDTMELITHHLTTLRIRKDSWGVFPRIFIVLFIFLNIFSNAFL